MPRESGNLPPEQLAKEREARAAREEIFRRICVEVEATGSTFEQAASQLGAPHHVIRYFQADYENARVKESLASRRLAKKARLFRDAVRRYHEKRLAGRCSLQRRLADPWFGHIGSTSLS